VCLGTYVGLGTSVGKKTIGAQGPQGPLESRLGPGIPGAGEYWGLQDSRGPKALYLEVWEPLGLWNPWGPRNL
jgi:hypothetical protein